MIVLPKSLVAIADATANDSGRYSMTGVMLKETVTPQGVPCFRLEATDGKLAVIIRGESDPIPKRCAMPDAEDLDEGVPEAIVPRGAFIQAMKGLGKEVGINDRLVIHLMENEILLASSDTVSRSLHVMGRFPGMEKVFPKRPALCSFLVDPRRMIDAMRIALSVCDHGSERVEILYYGHGEPVGFIGRGVSGILDMVLMPLA